jgi:hypothetical protein
MNESDNILVLLGVSTKEDVLSNLLRFCINSSRSFSSTFLRILCGSEGDPTEVTAHTRISAGDSGIPDLVILARTASETVLVVVENKLKADEGVDQTRRYASPQCVEHICGVLRVKPSEIRRAFVFLTLFPDQQPEAPEFKTRTYRQLVEMVPDRVYEENPTAARLLADLATLLKTFYAQDDLPPNAPLLEALRRDDPLESSYLAFRNFAHSLELPCDLEVEDVFRSSAQGRRFYGAVISKAAWHPRGMPCRQTGEHNCQSDCKWALDPEQDFNIHFEPQFNVLTGSLNIYLHYEVNPYTPVNQLLRHVSQSDYAGYNQLRDRFAKKLSNNKSLSLIFGGRSNQIARASLDIEAMSAQEVAQVLSGLVGKVGNAIDLILANGVAG